jgi:hypothetical protein
MEDMLTEAIAPSAQEDKHLLAITHRGTVDMHTGAIIPRSKEGMPTVAITPNLTKTKPTVANITKTKSPPVPGEKGKPYHKPRLDHNGDPYQAQIHRFDHQGTFHHTEEPRLVTAEEVMDHIIYELLQETKHRGPIRSALENGRYHQPHPVILLEPVALLTNRSKTGEYIQDSVPLDQEDIDSLLTLQAYHASELEHRTDNDDNDFFLDWDKWLHVTYTDLQ